jgi:hypothetical protein
MKKAVSSKAQSERMLIAKETTLLRSRSKLLPQTNRPQAAFPAALPGTRKYTAVNPSSKEPVAAIDSTGEWDSNRSADWQGVSGMERAVVHFSTVFPKIPIMKTAPAMVGFRLRGWSALWRTCGIAK